MSDKVQGVILIRFMAKFSAFKVLATDYCALNVIGLGGSRSSNGLC